VSLGVLLTAAAVALGAPLADPIIGLVITLVILRITWESWHTVRR
jgi:divalent metal cation (Fe/Co/Zn/Cd) transporter